MGSSPYATRDSCSIEPVSSAGSPDPVSIDGTNQWTTIDAPVRTIQAETASACLGRAAHTADIPPAANAIPARIGERFTLACQVA
jgi:hypothetical protein